MPVTSTTVMTTTVSGPRRLSVASFAPRVMPTLYPRYAELMCRSIKTLYNIEPATNEDEVREAALQFVRKISGYRKPSKANEEAFEAAVDEIAGISWKLLSELETAAPARPRELVHASRR